MGIPITLSNISNAQQITSASSVINNNNAAIESALSEALSTTNQTSNSMNTNLDMNSNQILNLPSPATTHSPARLIDVVSNPTISVPPVGTSGATVPLMNGNNTWSGINTFTANTVFTGVPFTEVLPTNSSADVTNINNALAAGGIVQLAPGTFQAGGTSITVPSNTWLRGSGKGTTILQVPSGSAFTGTLITCSLSSSNIRVSDFTIDGFDNTSSSGSCINFREVNNLSIDHIQIIRMYGDYGIAVQQATNFNISDNDITLTTPRVSPNEAIITTQAWQNSRGRIANNICVNSGTEIDGQYIQILDNVIYGWGFGSGITTGGNTISITSDMVISGNVVYGSLTGMDTNNFYPSGIEVYVNGSIISNNNVYGTAGPGILTGGVNGLVCGNSVHDCDTGYTGAGAAGILVQYGTSPYLGTNTIVTGNTVFNTNGAAGPQQYALSVNLLCTGVIIGPNNFQPGATGTVYGPVNYVGDVYAYKYGGFPSNGTYPIYNNSQGIYATSANFTNGNGEVDFWNVFGSALQSFNWYQQTGNTSKTLLMSLSPSGNLSLPAVQYNALTFATLPASPVAGMTAYITDCNTNTWGATAAGSGTDKVLVWYNGSNWTVVGK